MQRANTILGVCYPCSKRGFSLCWPPLLVPRAPRPPQGQPPASPRLPGLEQRVLLCDGSPTPAPLPPTQAQSVGEPQSSPQQRLKELVCPWKGRNVLAMSKGAALTTSGRWGPIALKSQLLGTLVTLELTKSGICGAHACSVMSDSLGPRGL